MSVPVLAMSKAEAREALGEPEPVRPHLQTMCFADIAPEKIDWLWPGQIALGKLTVIAGDPGLGKSMLTAYLAACVSRGRSWPEGGTAPCGDVLIGNAEDGAADTIRPRLDAAGADPTRVHCMELIKTGDSLRAFTLADVQPLADALEALKEPRLVIIDPVSAFMGGADSHVASDVRGLLAPIAKAAQRRGCAVVLVAHLNKAQGMTAMARVNGSGAYVAAARAAWIVSADKDDPERRLFLPLKNNLAPNLGGFAYRIDTTADDVPYVRFEPGRVNVSADDALSRPQEGESDSDAVAFLRDLLSNGGRPAKEVSKEARDYGLSDKQLRTAREKLHIRPKKTGMNGGWIWELPCEGAPEGAQDAPICVRAPWASSREKGHLHEDEGIEI